MLWGHTYSSSSEPRLHHTRLSALRFENAERPPRFPVGTRRPWRLARGWAGWRLDGWSGLVLPQLARPLHGAM